MSEDLIHRKYGFALLTDSNYRLWALNAAAYLGTQGLWDVWQPSTTPPPEPVLLAIHNKELSAATNTLFLLLSDELKLRFVEDKTSAMALWTAIRTAFTTVSAGDRFVAAAALSSIFQGDDETVLAFSERVAAASRAVMNLQPEGYTVRQMNEDMRTYAFIRGARTEFKGVSDVLAGAASITFQEATSKLHAVENNNASITISAARASTSTPTPASVHAAFTPSSSSSPSTPRPNRPRLDKSKWYCDFCKVARSHTTDFCSKKKAFDLGVASTAHVAQNSTFEGAHYVSEYAGAASTASSPSSAFPPPDSWNADTGATSHMTPRREWFQEYSPCSIPVRVANGKVIMAVGVGKVQMIPKVDGKALPMVTFTRVLHVPLLTSNLLSVLSLTTLHHYQVHIHDHLMDFFVGTELWFRAKVDASRTAYLEVETLLEQTAASVRVSVLGLELWHRRLGHIGMDRLKQLSSGTLVHGLRLKSAIPHDASLCESCLAGKQHRTAMPKSVISRATVPLELVHSDLHGPTHVAAQGGYRYWVVFIDDATRYRMAYKLKKKSDTFAAFQAFKIFAEAQTGHRIKGLHEDKGGEYMSNAFAAFLTAHGIRRFHTTRNSPQENGVAERSNRILDEGITASLHEANLPSSFWGYALSNYLSILNRSPTSAVKGMVPHEAFYKRKPTVADVRVFGCRVWIHVPKDRRQSFQPKTLRCIYLGPAPDFKAWNCYDPLTRKMHVSRDAIFDESNFPGLSMSPDDPTYNPVIPPGLHKPAVVNPDVFDTFSDFGADSDDGGAPAGTPDPPLPPAGPIHPPIPPIHDPSPPPHSPSPPPHSPSPPPAPRVPRIPPVPKPPTRTRRNASASGSKSNPAPAQTRHSTRTSKPPGEWWKLPTPPPPAPVVPPAPVEPAPERYRTPVPEFPPDSEDDSPAGDSDSAESLDFLADQHADAAFAFAEHSDAAFLHSVEHAQSAVSEQVLIEYAFATSNEMPRTFRESQVRDDAAMWRDAAQSEIDSLVLNETWDLVPLPAGRKAIGSRWVFVIKQLPDGTVDRYKARVVAKGYSQIYELDYTETYAPVTKFASLRTVLAIAAIHDMELYHLDVSTAFLNAKLDPKEWVYMRQPEGFAVKGKEHLVCHVKRALYGLKQSGRMWSLELFKTMEELGFKKVASDPSVFVFAKDGTRILLPVYVDDLAMASNNAAEAKRVIGELEKRYKLRHSELSVILGIEVHRDRANRRIHLSQSKYTKDIINRFQLSTSNPVVTPIDPSASLSMEDCPAPDSAEWHDMQSIPYLSAVGSLNYLSTATRPDISHAVSRVSRFNQNPGKAHWHAVLRIFKYLLHTPHFALEYSPHPDSAHPSLSVFSDASYAQEEGAKSTTGWATFIGNCLVSWASKRQSVVAKSTSEAEWIAANGGAQDLVWFRKFLMEIGFPQADHTPLWVDNESTIRFGQDGQMNGRMKHMKVAYYWLKERIEEDKEVKLHHVPGLENTADILTKGLARELHEFHCHGMGLVSMDEVS